MTFYSKKGILFPVLACFLLVMAFVSLTGKIFIITIVMLLISLYLIWVWFDTYYRVKDGLLYYRSALIKGSIDISTITQVVKNKSQYSGIKIALSTNGMIVKYNKWDDIYISPKDEAGFIAALKSVIRILLLPDNSLLYFLFLALLIALPTKNIITMNHWLVKSEPHKYSWEKFNEDGRTFWDGVRNYQARNNLRDMKEGDLVLFYHSNEGKEVVGIAKVVKEFYQDPTTSDPNWVVVDLAPVESLKATVTLETIKADERLKNIHLVKQGRLSVMGLKREEFDRIVELGNS